MFLAAGMADYYDESRLRRLSRDSLNNGQNKVERGQGVSYCAFVDEEPGGYIYANVNGLDQRSFITSVYVRENRRGQGIGRKLMEALIDRLESTGIMDVGLAVTATNEGALRLYESLGFNIQRYVMRRKR